MNLKEMLDYRNNCIICNREMIIRCQDLIRMSVKVTDKGLVVKTGHADIGIIFKYDGTYQKNSKWSDLLSKPLTIIKECPTCRRGNKSKTVVLKGRSVGATTSTLDNLKSLHNFYTIEIFGDEQGQFDCHLDEECIKYCDDKAFYHVATKFQDDKTKLTHGRFSETIGSVFYLNCPTWKTSSIRDINHYLDKYKTYIIFS